MGLGKGSYTIYISNPMHYSYYLWVQIKYEQIGIELGDLISVPPAKHFIAACNHKWKEAILNKNKILTRSQNENRLYHQKAAGWRYRKRLPCIRYKNSHIACMLLRNAAPYQTKISVFWRQANLLYFLFNSHP